MKKPKGVKKNKQRLFAFSSVLIGIVVGLLVLEVVLRIFSIKPERYEHTKIFVLQNSEYKDLGEKGKWLYKRRSKFYSEGVVHLPVSTYPNSTSYCRTRRDRLGPGPPPRNPASGGRCTETP